MPTREGQNESGLGHSCSGTTGLRLGGTESVRRSRISFVLSKLYGVVATVLYTDVHRISATQQYSAPFQYSDSATAKYKNSVLVSLCTLRSPSPTGPRWQSGLVMITGPKRAFSQLLGTAHFPLGTAHFPFRTFGLLVKLHG